MKTGRWLANMVTAAALVALGACGGGGGDNTPTGPTIDVSSVNRDTVVHAAVAGVWGLTLATTTPLPTGSSGSARSVSAWLQTHGARLPSAASQREHPTAVFGPTEVPCDVSGSMTVTWDDADNDLVIGSVGDVLTGVFRNCVDPDLADATVVNGTLVARVLSETSMRMEMTQFSLDTSRHTMTVTGAVRVTMVSVDTAQTTTEGEVTVNVALNHVAPPFTDTVTLQSGFVAQETISNGEMVRTVNGLLESAAAGGIVRLTTPSNALIRQLATQDYPYTGVLRVQGMSSALQMTVLSASQVQLDLDADGNGTFDSTTTVLWDWLL